jgi:virulence factor Mce-like protein
MNVRTGISMAGMLAIAIASFIYMNALGLQVKLFENLRTATMGVPDTNGLVVGSRVLLRGVPIGAVTAVVPSAGGVKVDWQYDRSYDIPVDATFRLDNLSALGEAYVAVLPHSDTGPYLEDDAEIAADRVTVPTTVKELSARLTRLLEQAEPEKLQQIFHELDTALPQGTQVLQDLSRAGALLATMLIDNTEDMTGLLNNAQSLLLDSSWLAPGLSDTTTDIARFGTGLGGFLNAAADTSVIAPLPDGIALGTGPFLAELQRFLDKAAPDIHILAVDTLPAVRAGAASIRTIDIGHLLDTALASTATGDSITLRVDLQGK